LTWKLSWNVLKMSWQVHLGLYPFFFFFFNQWIDFKFENVKYISIYLKNCFGGNNLTWKIHDNFQVKLFPPKIIFFNFFLKIFVKYMLMYLTFSNLNSIHRIIKKDIDLYVLFRTFHDNFQVKLFPPKNIFLNFLF
jgi:hypothetical protein